VSPRDTTTEPRPRPVLGVLVVLVVGSLFVIGELSTAGEQEAETGIMLAIVLVTLIAGFLVTKRPNHPISWLMAAGALAGGIAGMSAEALPPGSTEMAGFQAVVALLSGGSWYGMLLFVLVLIPLLFPTGSPPSPRWRWVTWLSVTTWVIMSALWMLQESFCTDWDSSDTVCTASVENPIGIPGLQNPEQSPVGSFLFGTLVVCSLIALSSLVVRFRRSKGIERQQIKWVLLSVSLFVVGSVLIDEIWIRVLGQAEPTGPFFYWLDQLLWLIIPVSVAVAILRYRLYDIDRVISRTVSYVIVIGLLVLIYALAVTGLTTLLDTDSSLVVAGSTLAVAALFNPLRRRVQSGVDHRFNRTRYDAELVVAGFTGSLRDEVDPERVTDGLVSVVKETMHPASAGIWVRK
jgi:hypothetical protein